MNIDLAISLSIFLIFVSIAIIFSINYFSQLPIWRSLGELREIATEVREKLFSGEGVIVEIYRIRVLVEEDFGSARENEPIEVELILDEECLNKSLNSSIRVQDEDWDEVPFVFLEQGICSGNYLESAKISFNVNISAYERKIFQVFYHDKNVTIPSYNVTFSTSSWIPNDGDSWTESTTDWSAYDSTVTLDSANKKVGDYSVNTTGNFPNQRAGLIYNPLSDIQGVENGWYLRAWLFVDNKTDLRIFLNLSDGLENISYEVTDNMVGNDWYLFEEEISSQWQGWQNFNASQGIDFVIFYAENQTSGITRTLKIDGLRFEKKPLKITVFPEEKVEVISREKLEELRNRSVEEIIGIIGRGYKVRIEISEVT
jgi:hypothetical protein